MERRLSASAAARRTIVDRNRFGRRGHERQMPEPRHVIDLTGYVNFAGTNAILRRSNSRFRPVAVGSVISVSPEFAGPTTEPTPARLGRLDGKAEKRKRQQQRSQADKNHRGRLPYHSRNEKTGFVLAVVIAAIDRARSEFRIAPARKPPAPCGARRSCRFYRERDVISGPVRPTARSPACCTSKGGTSAGRRARRRA